MKVQSAMMQLKYKLQLEIENITKCINQDEYLKGYRTAFENMIKDIDSQILEMERQNIIDAHIEIMKQGLLNEGDIIWTDYYLPKIKETAETYYTQTFKD